MKQKKKRELPRPLIHRVGLAVVSAAKDVDHKIAGANAIAEWLGPDHEPVETSVAEKRAAVCLSCPMHRKGDWWGHILSRIGSAARHVKETRERMDLRLDADEKLGKCTVCDCPMVLKVWVDRDFILEHTDAETMSELPEHCWIKC